MQHGQARNYPDAHLWKKAHDKELDNLDNNKVVIWLPPKQIPNQTKPIPLTIGYRYKRNDPGEITERKARCSARGD